jgi:hypothetical protein
MSYNLTNPHGVAALVIASLAVFSSIAQAQNLLTNPSFELGTFVNRGDGFQILEPGATDITGWTVFNGELAWGTTPNSAAITAFDGSMFLDLQGDGLKGPPFGGVTQSITTVAGSIYHLSFYLGTQQSTSNCQGPVSVSATADGTTMPFNPGGTGTQWGQFGFDFTATGTSAPISIFGTSTAGGAYIGLDLVSVEFVSAAVPEPATWATGVSVALLLVFHYRKNKRQA